MLFTIVNANSWPAIHMKLRFCIAKVQTHNNCNIYVCVLSGSSLSGARRQISFTAGLPVVLEFLKFLKFHRCPEIVLKLEIVLKFYSFGQNVLKLIVVMLS